MGYLVFLKKEFTEQVKLYRFVIIIVTFALVGILSPLFAKFLPDMMELASKSSDQMLGMEIMFTKEMNQVDALLQYTKNFGLIPILIIVLSMGLIVKEKTAGTLELILTKPILREAIILSKFTALSITILIGIIVSALINYTYIIFLFEKGGIYLSYYILINSLLYIYLLSFLAMILLFSVMLKSQGMVACVGLIIYILFSIFTFIKYLPANLMETVNNIILGENYSIVEPLISSVIIIILSLFISIYLFRKQEI